MMSDTSITRFHPASPESGLEAVLAAVSEFKRTDATGLHPLNRCVDADAVNLLFGGPGSSTMGIEEGTLSFRYDDVFVTVTHDGFIEVVDADAFYTRPAAHSIWSDVRAQQSPEAALNAAAAALAEAEEHIWTAASNTPDNEHVDPLWAIVERLWDVQSSLDTVSQSSSAESRTIRSDDRP